MSVVSELPRGWFKLGKKLFAGGNQLSDLADPEDAQDAATKAYVDAKTGDSTATATVTTDPDTFLASHVFDLGRSVGASYLTVTLLSFDADGETIDPETGIVALFAVDWNTDAGFTAPTTGPMNAGNEIVDVGDADYLGAVIPRYLRVSASILDKNTGDLYAGANHPTAQLRLDVDYL
jgi:hypothetical protein